MREKPPEDGRGARGPQRQLVGRVGSFLSGSGRSALALVILLVSFFFLGAKLLKASTVQITVGGNETTVKQIPSLFTSTDVAWIVASSMLVAGSLIFLLSRKPAGKEPTPPVALGLVDSRKTRWEDTHQRLTGNEKMIYGVILESGGMAYQSEIIEKSGLGKVTVSTTLNRLQARDLVEKRRDGMANIVVLK